MTGSESRTAASIPSFAFIGIFGVGKTTFSNRLKEKLDKEFGTDAYRPSFSAKIIEIAKDLFNMKDYDRTLLQEIGTKMRDIDPGVWAKYLVRHIKDHGKLPFIVDGIRKPEELSVLKEEFQDMIVIRLEADAQGLLEAYKRQYGKYPTTEEMTNDAERSIPNLHDDMVIFNNYTVEEMDRQLDAIIKAIREGTIRQYVKESMAAYKPKPN